VLWLNKNNLSIMKITTGLPLSKKKFNGVLTKVIFTATRYWPPFRTPQKPISLASIYG
jgi:hypothetical protein